MTERDTLIGAAGLCRRYAMNLREDHPSWSEVAIVCAEMIEEASEVGIDGVLILNEKTLPVVCQATGSTTGSAKSRAILQVVSSDFFRSPAK